MFRIFPPLDLGVLGLRPPTGAEDRVIVISKEMLNEDIEINPGAKEGGPSRPPGPLRFATLERSWVSRLGHCLHRRQ